MERCRFMRYRWELGSVRVRGQIAHSAEDVFGCRSMEVTSGIVDPRVLVMSK
jgi:hypothetical protein